MTSMEQAAKKSKIGDIVTIHFTCTMEDGTLVDTSLNKEPLELEIGMKQVIPGLEHAVIGMKPGESRKVQISCDQAYGPYKNEMLKTIPLEQFPGITQPEVGIEFRIELKEGETRTIRVTKVTDTSVTLDANHPMAGKTLFFDIKLLEIIKSGPDADSYYKLGMILQEKGQIDEAIKCFEKAAEIQPDFIEVFYILGIIYQSSKQYIEAIAHYEKVLHIDQNHVQSHNNLGTIYRQMGRLDDALIHHKKALEIDSGHADTYNNLGAVFQAQGKLDEALKHYQLAVQMSNDFGEAYNNLGNVLMLTGKFDEAHDAYQKAVRILPDLANAQYNIALLQLLRGDFREGWKNYDWRFHTEDFSSVCFDLPQPVWDGSSLDEKTLLVCSEQGVGDEIMFASCLPEVVEQVGRCFIECEKRLLPLFERSFPQAVVKAAVDTHNTDRVWTYQADSKIAIGSLPKFLRPDPASFPKRKFYLVADSEQIEIWRKRFAEVGKGLKVGISWRGGKHPYVKNMRSIPLEKWSPLFSLPGIHIINLQYGEYGTELQEFYNKYGKRFYTWEDANPIEDLDNFAAQISALDIIISIDNATVHMAGALGARVWTLLPAIPDWRWMLEREDTLWYPTMRLFRQPSMGDWDTVLSVIAKEVEALLH